MATEAPITLPAIPTTTVNGHTVCRTCMLPVGAERRAELEAPPTSGVERLSLADDAGDEDSFVMIDDPCEPVAAPAGEPQQAEEPKPEADAETGSEAGTGTGNADSRGWLGIPGIPDPTPERPFPYNIFREWVVPPPPSPEVKEALSRLARSHFERMKLPYDEQIKEVGRIMNEVTDKYHPIEDYDLEVDDDEELDY